MRTFIAMDGNSATRSTLQTLHPNQSRFNSPEWKFYLTVHNIQAMLTFGYC